MLTVRHFTCEVMLCQFSKVHVLVSWRSYLQWCSCVHSVWDWVRWLERWARCHRMFVKFCTYNSSMQWQATMQCCQCRNQSTLVCRCYVYTAVSRNTKIWMAQLLPSHKALKSKARFIATQLTGCWVELCRYGWGLSPVTPSPEKWVYCRAQLWRRA